MRKLFTTIELMVVVAIISILLTITIPAITKARDNAYSKTCVNNLRNIGLGMMIYTGDYNDFTMPASFGNTNDGQYNHFINYMIAEMDYSPENFKCSGMNENDMFDPAGHDPRVGNVNRDASYIMNIVKPGSWTGAPVPDNSAAHGWGLDSVTPIKVGLVTTPASKLHVLDVMLGVSNSHSGVNNFQRSDHGLVNDPPTGYARWVGNHHNYKFNSVFGDGHVETMYRSESIDWAVNR
jgi:type II secretory pathway pseudopilin PulG